MFVEQKKPKDFDCGYNLDRMIDSLPRIKDKEERIEYAKRAVGLIKQSHPNWVDEDGESEAAWDHFFELADYDPTSYGINNPFDAEDNDDAR
jgi:tRNA splicing ligase